MSLNLLKPTYSRAVIGSLQSLGAALGLEEAALLDLAARAGDLYRPVPPKPGSNRETFDARGLLKVVHGRIKTGILENVIFPGYITGSTKGKDYKENARLHSGKYIIICEDVKGFFPSVNAEAVYAVWRGFFKFSPRVSRVLTDLTTKDGSIPQGAIPSSYLANLVLWQHEPLLHAKFSARGLTYSRYVDDMVVSSGHPLKRPEITQVVAEVYGMLSKIGLRAGRHKHEIFTASQRMIVTKLMVNARPALQVEKRSAVRAAVFQLEQAVEREIITMEMVHAVNKLGHRVGQLSRFHPSEGAGLKVRLRAMRALMEARGLPSLYTGPDKGSHADPVPDLAMGHQLPWE